MDERDVSIMDLQRSWERMREERDEWRAKYEALLRQPCPTCAYYEGDLR